MSAAKVDAPPYFGCRIAAECLLKSLLSWYAVTTLFGIFNNLCAKVAEGAARGGFMGKFGDRRVTGSIQRCQRAECR
jgi:hypothetical protein